MIYTPLKGQDEPHTGMQVYWNPLSKGDPSVGLGPNPLGSIFVYKHFLNTHPGVIHNMSGPTSLGPVLIIIIHSYLVCILGVLLSIPVLQIILPGDIQGWTWHTPLNYPLLWTTVSRTWH